MDTPRPLRALLAGASYPLGLGVSRMSATFADVRRQCLAMPDVTEGRSRGRPAFYRKKRLILRQLSDTVIVVLMTVDQREVLIRAKPKIFSIDAHYQRYPACIVNLKTVPRGLLTEVLKEAWRLKDEKRVRRGRASASTATSSRARAPPCRASADPSPRRGRGRR